MEQLTSHSAASTGPQVVGMVWSKRGKVTAKKPCGAMRILHRGDPLYPDDMVHTVRGANAQLKMADETIIMLRGGCHFRVSLYRPEPAAADTAKRYEYVGGALRESRRDAFPSSFDLSLG